MRPGLRPRQKLRQDLQHHLVEAASAAVAAGYARLWTYGRWLFLETPVEPYAGTNVPRSESLRQAADPLATLTAALSSPRAARVRWDGVLRGC